MCQMLSDLRERRLAATLSASAGAGRGDKNSPKHPQPLPGARQPDCLHETEARRLDANVALDRGGAEVESVADAPVRRQLPQH